MTIPQVVWSGNGPDVSDIRPIPLLRHRIGPGAPPNFDAFHGYMPFPATLVSGLPEPLAGYLAADLALPSAYRMGDLVLLERNRAMRVAPAASSCWVVAESGGLRVRYVRRTHNGLETGREPGLTGPRDWQAISLQGRNILEIVRAKIVWIGREMETPVGGPSGQARAGD